MSVDIVILHGCVAAAQACQLRLTLIVARLLQSIIKDFNLRLRLGLLNHSSILILRLHVSDWYEDYGYGYRTSRGAFS